VQAKRLVAARDHPLSEPPNRRTPEATVLQRFAAIAL
jgi:hypothetical protein